MTDEKSLEETLKAARAAAAQLRVRLGAVKIAPEAGKAVDVFIPKAMALVHDIEAFIKKAEKDLK